MATLAKIQRYADQLPEGDRLELAAHLVASTSAAPSGPDDLEADRRDQEMNSGVVNPIGHREFLRQADRA